MTDSDTAQLTMELNSAPDGGRIVAWEGDDLSGYELRLDSDDPGMTWEHYRKHTHVNLGFTGAWRIRGHVYFHHVRWLRGTP